MTRPDGEIDWEEFLGPDQKVAQEPVVDHFKGLSGKISRHLSDLYQIMDAGKRTVAVDEIVEFTKRFMTTIGVNAPVKMLDDVEVSGMDVLGRLPIKIVNSYDTPFALVVLSNYDIDTLEEVPTVYIQNPRTMRPLVFN